MRLTMYAVTKTLLVNFMLVKTFPTCVYCILHGMSFRRLMIMVLALFPNLIIVTFLCIRIWSHTI